MHRSGRGRNAAGYPFNRLFEVLALRRDDVDLDLSLLEIRDPKNGTPRQHPINVQAIALGGGA